MVKLAVLTILISTVFKLTRQDASHSIYFSCFRFTLHSHSNFSLTTHFR